jgi:hypothetical protein
VSITDFVDTSRPHNTKDHIRLGEMNRFWKAALGGGRHFFEFLLGDSHVARGMFRDPRIVLGLMAVWTLLLIAWALFER